MLVVQTINEARAQSKLWKNQGLSIGLVPTMGFLHEGHRSLIEKALSENDKVVVSIFVNPTQFAPNEDLEKYPRDFAADKALCEQHGVAMIFHPSAAEMYPQASCTTVRVDKLGTELCGKGRPVHFGGVCLVVNKLFNIIAPHKAYFGQKDAQQLAIVQKMVADLNIDVEIVPCPTIREHDGLAKSSRNAYLTPAQRQAATVISRALFSAKNRIEHGERSIEAVVSHVTKILQSEQSVNIEYVNIVDSQDINKKTSIEGQVLLAIAVRIGSTRLIDNIFITI